MREARYGNGTWREYATIRAIDGYSFDPLTSRPTSRRSS